MTRLKALIACLLIPAVLPGAARAAGAGDFVDGVNFEALQAIQAQLKQIIKAPQLQQTPLVIPVVDFGDKRDARYRFKRKDEVFSLDGSKRPVSVGWEISDVVETSGGSVERLLSVEPAGAAAEGNKDFQSEKRKVSAESARLAKLRNDNDEKAKIEKKQKSDEDGLVKMVAEFPRALRYKFEGIERDANGDELARESFESNDCSHKGHVDPCFTPKSQEARIYEGMKGMIWVRVRDKHLVRFSTVIDHDVKFGWGIFSAKAKKGGAISITLSDVDGSGKRWVISALEDHLTIEKSAMAALFSGGSERDNDNQAMSGFEKVADMTFDQGIDLLRR